MTPEFACQACEFHVESINGLHILSRFVITILRKKKYFSDGLNQLLNPVWHGTGHFYLYVFVRSDFVSLIFFKNFQTLLKVKIEINRVILTPCPAH